MCQFLPSLVSIIAFIASVPKFCLLSVFKVLARPQVGSWVSEWARFISSRELPLASPIIGTFVLGSTLVRVLFRHLHTLAWNLLAATTKYFRVYLLCYLMPTFLSIARQVVSFVREIVTCHLVPSFFSSALEIFMWVSREVPLAKVIFHLRHILAWDLLIVFFMVYRTVRSISQHARKNLGFALVFALYLLPRGVSAMESNSGGGAASTSLALALYFFGSQK